MIKITERGWAGHHILSRNCLFRRNTLIEGKKDAVVVSTVGNMFIHDEPRPIGLSGLWYETVVFGVEKEGEYIEANVQDQRSTKNSCGIYAAKWEDLSYSIDNQANDMHEAVVAEFVKLLS